MSQQAQPAHASARLFLALVPDDGVRTALAKHCDQWHWTAHATRYGAPDWHVTLHFIGPVARHQLDELRAALDLPLTPFQLCLRQPELWPHGLAVLCPEAVPAALQQLHARLGQALQRLGLPTDPRPLRPHITLARHAQDAQPPLQRPMVDWQVAGYALMASTGTVAPRYRVLQQYRSAS